MGVARQIGSMRRVFPTARRNKSDAFRWLGRRPQLLAAIAVHEVALVTSGRVDMRLKALGEIKAAALTNCEYCLDIGSAFARDLGLTEAQLRALPTFRDSGEFDDTEKLVLELAEAMSRTPAHIGDDLRARLLGRFSRTQLTELAAAIAWENHRGRLNQALGIRPSGFSDGGFCVVPEK
ncbi:carboxymuconolactone decarboxylase family protein [Rhodococcus sp. UNC363MFTsu5.1]|uniref:carboxymuconolactone decarboxylase family protein n=1 Tax=Rhodococcus sp. UNC363MFTsu5.1 TaxID=1449069 RepID=UPI0004813C70|nr:carboxymuconolactone decarboxylase family protein [Rhodococcus sp. UNC363MFTsu5.1]